MTQAERLALARNEAVEKLAIPEDAVQVGIASYVIRGENGLTKLVVSGIKEVDYDVAQAHQDWLDDVAKKANAKAEREAKAEVAKQADLRKKAEAKAKKEAAEA